MKCIKRLTDEDFEIKPISLDNPRHRYAARGIVFNKNNEIAILNKSLKNEYKLVGGGIDEEEDPTKAFKREVLEEAGCTIDIDDCLGTIEEIKSQDNFIQTSYVYVAHVIKDTGETSFTEKEINEGARLVWLDINKAMELIKNSEDKLVASDYENVYHSKFIVRRDYEILKYYINHS